MTQSELAELVGVKPPTVSLWENGHNASKMDTRRRLAELFKVTTAELDSAIDSHAADKPPVVTRLPLGQE